MNVWLLMIMSSFKEIEKQIHRLIKSSCWPEGNYFHKMIIMETMIKKTNKKNEQIGSVFLDLY